MSESFDAVVGTKRQVTLPAGLLRRLSLNEGDHVRFTVDGDSVYLEPMVSVPRHLVSESLLREMNERRGARSSDLSLAEFRAGRRETEATGQELVETGAVMATDNRVVRWASVKETAVEADEPPQRWMTAE